MGLNMGLLYKPWHMHEENMMNYSPENTVCCASGQCTNSKALSKAATQTLFHIFQEPFILFMHFTGYELAVLVQGTFAYIT